MQVPSSDLGLIGGSSTLSIEIPDDLGLDGVKTEESGLRFQTPYGISPDFCLLGIHGPAGYRQVLSCRMHGWRTGVGRADASRQVFWVFREAGVKRILAEGGVGAVNHLLRPRDIVVPNDYMDHSMRRDVGMEQGYLLIMRDALCPDMRRLLVDACQRLWKDGRVFDRGIYVNTDGRHFESPAEVQSYKMMGGDLVGQSICPEVYLAREIGACYAGLYMVVNYAEGIVSPWRHEELAEIFHHQAHAVGRILFDVLQTLPVSRDCQCSQLRKNTLLSKVYKS